MAEVTELIPREVMARVKEIELRMRRAVEEFLVGRYHSAFRGRGVEFHEVREYLVGDDVRGIDWNVTARFGRPFVKTYVEERELTLMVLFDASASMSFGGSGRSKRQAALEVLALLAMSAVRNDDRVGMVMHGVGAEPAYFPAGKGRDYALRLLREAYFRRAAAQSAGLGAALKSVLAIERRRVVLVAIGDFMEAGEYETALKIAARQHDCVAAFVYDALEEALPAAGIVELEDPETGARLPLDTSSPAVRAAWTQRFRRHQRQLEDTCLRNDIDLITIRPDSDIVSTLVRLFGRRTRRLAT